MPPTLRQVAAAAGVHHTTLSRALRGHPDVSAGKAAELRALAEKMGYVPDPMLRALAAYRSGRRPVAFHSVIAYINPTPYPEDLRRFNAYRNFYDSAEGRARELGFRLELICVPDGGGASRITSMLRARNITGVIVGPVSEGRVSLDMIEWKDFAAVKIGHSVRSPQLHTIAPERVRAMRMIMDELVARGYRRPGLLLERRLDGNVDMQWSAAFMRHQLRFARKDRLPLHLAEGPLNDGMAAWIRKHRPDVIIAMGDERIPPLLRRRGIRIPADLGYAALVQPNAGDLMAGIAERSDEIGAAAVDFVVAMVNRQERGVPSFPQTLLINNAWTDGPTLRPRQAAVPAHP